VKWKKGNLSSVVALEKMEFGVWFSVAFVMANFFELASVRVMLCLPTSKIEVALIYRNYNYGLIKTAGIATDNCIDMRNSGTPLLTSNRNTT